MGALPARQNQFVEYAEKDSKMRSISDAIDNSIDTAAEVVKTKYMIASEFNANTGYGVGSLVIYQGKLYRCVKFHYGAWSGVDFQESTVSQAMSNDRANVVNLAGIIAQQYSADATYAVGDYVINNYNLYVCNTAIETVEPWNAAHWTLVSRKLVNPLMEDIVDSDGYKRFQKFEATLNPIAGLTISYAKASLSGTHLMLVIAGSIANGTTITNGTTLTYFPVPDFIYNEVYPVWGDIYIETKQTLLYGADWSTQTLSAVLQKTTNNRLAILNTGNLTLNADRSFRVQFDLLID